MSSRFINVPAATLENFLASKGFTRGVHGHEVVYRRRHEVDPHYVVCVYTSIRDGASQVRGPGEDAIRVTAFQELDEGRSRGIAKCQRVFRTGTIEGVLGRILERAREAYDVCTKRIRWAQCLP